MSTTLQIRKNFQITLPARLRKRLGLKVGDLIEVEDGKEGIILKPKRAINVDQAWFWEEKWLEGEKEAQNDIEKGRVKEFKNVEDLIKELKK